MMNDIYLGIDISKMHIDCAFKINESYQYVKITNDEAGFQFLLDFMQQKNFHVNEIHACCEATNIYYLAIANFLIENNVKISVVNPKIIKSFAEYHLKRVKTDKQDAKLIADYCESAKPQLWQQKTQQQIKLTSLHRRCNQLNQMLVAEKQRLDVADEYTQESIEKVIVFFESELKNCRQEMQTLIESDDALTQKQKILESITGVGRTTSQILLPVLSEIDKFSSHKKLICYLGLSPIIKKSGTYQGKEKVSKMGDSSIRKALYMPARSACTRSKLWRAWFDKQIARGKHAKQVYVMMMTKIIKYAYYCIKNNEMFDAQRHEQRILAELNAD